MISVPALSLRGARPARNAHARSRLRRAPLWLAGAHWMLVLEAAVTVGREARRHSPYIPPPIPKSSLRGSAFAAPPSPSPPPPSLPTKCDTGRLQVPRIKVSLQSKLCSNIKKRFFIVHAGEKSGNDQEEARLQNASKQIVCTAIQQAVRQLSQESQTEEKATSSSVSLQLERRQSTKKHEKK
uniref:A-kinase anchor protein inhibitor 1 isoform X1 n=1 Tax=Pogona vitticeps TaxID=103695 RepID=A0ABM5GB98_9SAUR